MSDLIEDFLAFHFVSEDAKNWETGGLTFRHSHPSPLITSLIPINETPRR